MVGKHTPEWEVDGDDEYEGVPFIVVTETMPNGGVRGVCDVSPTLDEKTNKFVLTEDDYKRAHLIAAAPKLLETLVCVEAVMSIVEPRSEKQEYLQTLDRVRSAIAKATGADDAR